MKRLISIIFVTIIILSAAGCQGEKKEKAEFLKYETAPEKSVVLKDFEKYSPERYVSEYADEDDNEESYVIRKRYSFEGTVGSLWFYFDKDTSVMKKTTFVAETADTETPKKWVETLNQQFDFYHTKKQYDDSTGETYYWIMTDGRRIMLDYAQSEVKTDTVYVEINESFPTPKNE